MSTIRRPCAQTTGFEIVKPADVGLLEPEFSWMQTIYVPQKLVLR